MFGLQQKSQDIQKKYKTSETYSLFRREKKSIEHVLEKDQTYYINTLNQCS